MTCWFAIANVFACERLIPAQIFLVSIMMILRFSRFTGISPFMCGRSQWPRCRLSFRAGQQHQYR